MSEHGTTYQVDVYGTIDETYEGLTAAEANDVVRSARRRGDLVNVWNESTNRLVLQER